jgi:large subunit ribosomal protein L18
MRKQANQNQAKRRRRVRAKLARVSGVPRLSVFRSNRYVSGQIIDEDGKVLVWASESELEKTLKSKSKSERAEAVGKLIAGKASKAKIKTVKFDRGSYRYHGRVKAFAEGARAGGLQL